MHSQLALYCLVLWQPADGPGKAAHLLTCDATAGLMNFIFQVGNRTSQSVRHAICGMNGTIADCLTQGSET